MSTSNSIPFHNTIINSGQGWGEGPGKNNSSELWNLLTSKLFYGKMKAARRAIMKKITVLLGIFLIIPGLYAGQIISLPDLLNPDSIQVDEGRFYVAEGTSVYIYSLKDFKLVKKIGKEGEGPREFKILPFLPLFVNITDSQIVVNSFGKVSRFSKTGEWISEEKVKGGYLFFIMPVGDHLVAQGGLQEGKNRFRTVNIYDKQLNKIKEVCRVMDDFKGPGNGYDVLEKRFRHQVIGNRILVSKEKEFILDVYDPEGKKISVIGQDYDRVPMTRKDQEDITDYLKNSPRTKAFFPLFGGLRFPGHFPALMNLYCANNKIYVMTWRRNEGKNEFFIFNSSGQLIKKTYIPLTYRNAIEASPLAIGNDRLYQLVDNEKTDGWELHINELK